MHSFNKTVNFGYTFFITFVMALIKTFLVRIISLTVSFSLCICNNLFCFSFSFFNNIGSFIFCISFNNSSLISLSFYFGKGSLFSFLYNIISGKLSLTKHLLLFNFPLFFESFCFTTQIICSRTSILFWNIFNYFFYRRIILKER